jgi:hypothetical protein
MHLAIFDLPLDIQAKIGGEVSFEKAVQLIILTKVMIQ